MSFFYEYFNFTHKERNGILFLIGIVIVLWTIYFSIDYFFKPKAVHNTAFELQVDSFYKGLKDVTPLASANKLFKGTMDIHQPDINTLISMGVPKSTANAWFNYVSKGGKFNTLVDIKKLWGMNDSLYNLIASHLTFVPDTGKQNKLNKYEKKSQAYCANINSCELNSADSSMLISLPGIGESFARSIIKYRQRLGGFYQKEQLLEVYGFTQELLDKISPYIYIDTSNVTKINVNNADYITMIQHPYFTKAIVKGILQYQQKKVNFISTEELLTHQIISVDEWKKLRRYITIK